MKKIISLLIICSLFAISTQAQITRYVKPVATGLGHGGSWDHASSNLQAIINSSASGDQVWVAAGNFQPAAGQSFSMKDGVKIYGHFAGTETLLSQRNLNSTDTTFLIGNNGSNVITNNQVGIGNTALIDGFTIKHIAGNDGRGIYNYCSTPNISNCVFINNTANQGAAIYYYNGENCVLNVNQLEVSISNCTFLNNHTVPSSGGLASQSGGAIYAVGGAKITIDNCNFFNNYDPHNWGGAIYSAGRYTDIINCIIANNRARQGGGIYLSGNGQVNLINTILLNNTASETSTNFGGGGGLFTSNTNCKIINCLFTKNNGLGSAIFNQSGNAFQMRNTIVWDNNESSNGNSSGIVNPLNVQYSNTQNKILPGVGNKSVDPAFVNSNNPAGLDGRWRTADDGLRLICNSTNVDAGLNTAIPVGILTDIAGDPRNLNIVDMGPYELIAGTNGKLYVKPTVSGTGDGSSWANASSDLQEMINRANCRDSVFVAAGNYQLAAGQSFTMKEGVKIYGHFAGTETSFSQRNLFTNNTSFLIGNGNKVFNNNSNGLSRTAVLDGFTIKNGNSVSGSGMFNREVSPTVSNCIFENNTATTDGAGVYNSIANTLFVNCIFRNNTNGAMLNITSNTELEGCVFQSNTSASSGAGLRNVGCTDLKVTNCVFTENTTNTEGAAIFNNNSPIIITNSTIINNTAAGIGGAMYNLNASPIINNSIVWENATGIVNSGGTPVISFSNIQGGVPSGTGNISADPDFVNRFQPAGPDGRWATLDDGLMLQCASVSNSTGSNALVPIKITKDITNNQRLRGTVDMGAYEFLSSPTGKIFVTTTGAGTMDGHSWANATNNLQAAINTAYCSRDSVFVKTGTYLPANGLSFRMAENVKIFGHFSGTETSLTQRGLTNTDTTFLSGNGTRVITNINNNLTNAALLDGFTIKNGGGVTEGGGMNNTNSSPLIRNCTFQNNTAWASGGAVKNLNASPVFEHCIFQNNSAVSGGAMQNNNTSTQIKSCIFTNNTSTDNGGAISNFSSTGLLIVNSIFNNNSSVLGAAVYNNFSPLNFTHNTVYNNSGNGSLYITVGTNVNISNSIIWGNTSGIVYPGSAPTIAYSNVQGGVPAGTGNTSVSPVFTNAGNPKGIDDVWATADDGLILDCGSPLINAANNSLVPAGITNDVINFVRIGNGNADMGAYEKVQSTNNRLYVKQGGAGIKDGTTWANAIDRLDIAIQLACSGDSIFVAKGEYQPLAGLSFVMKEGVKIYGHFAGNESSLAQRNLNSTDTSFLSGNGGKVINNNINGLTNLTVLDGFTVKNGNSVSGSGMYNREVSPAISNCIFENNTASTDGAGVYNSLANPIFTNCIFRNNINGGMLNIGSNTNVVACIFQNNTSANSGAGMRNVGSAGIRVINSLFFDNTASVDGAAIYNLNSPILLSNSTIVQNTALGVGGGMFNINSAATIHNSIIWDNSTGIVNSVSTPIIHYSNVQGGVPAGTGNNSVDPMFYDANNPLGTDGKWNTVDDGYRLIGCSSALHNAGNNTLVPNDVTSDISGNARIQNGVVDMGCYETTEAVNGKLYVKQGGAGNKFGNSWANASNDLQFTIFRACPGDSVFVAAGNYQPAFGHSFEMKEGVKIYGHFAGTENTLTQRDLTTANNSYLSGNGYNTVVKNENNGLTNSAVLDGFTIQNGAYVLGAGMLNFDVSPKVSNCIFRNNITDITGGAVYQVGQAAGATPTFTDCMFFNNRSDYSGAGITVESASILINRCVFSENRIAAGQSGNALNFFSNSSPVFADVQNSLFAKNSGGNSLIAISGSAASSSFINCTIANNNNPPFQFSHPQNSVIKNSIVNNSFFPFISNNAPNIEYSNINFNLYPGTGNISIDPLFANANDPLGPDGLWLTADDGMRLNCGSPSINTGNNASLPVGATLDVTKATRIQQTTVDMGAYENASPASNILPATFASATELQNGSVTYGNCGNLVTTVASMGNSPVNGSTTAKVWIETVQSVQYVKRHYEIAPATGATTATGRVTLYFTQAEFDNFNTGNAVDLPSNPNDAAGKANLLIEKRGGVSSDGSGLPNTYSGSVSSINPADADIIWNTPQSRWEISFDVTGFSGFFVNTQSQPLPLNLLSFSGKAAENGNELTWETSNETNFSHFEIESSIDSKKFEKIGNKYPNESTNYEFLDQISTLGKGKFYRLKVIDLDDKYTYSKIIFIANGIINPTVKIYPNPAYNILYLENFEEENIVIINAMGQENNLKSSKIEENRSQINLSNLAKGLYFIKTKENKYLKFLKE